MNIVDIITSELKNDLDKSEMELIRLLMDEKMSVNDKVNQIKNELTNFTLNNNKLESCKMFLTYNIEIKNKEDDN
jgi:hypothetical protein